MYITILVKQVYWYISQVSGERLQDHWSSGLSVYVHVISFLFLNANNKVLAFCVTFPNLIFVFLCVVLSFHHAAHTAFSIFREISLP